MPNLRFFKRKKAMDSHNGERDVVDRKPASNDGASDSADGRKSSSDAENDESHPVRDTMEMYLKKGLSIGKDQALKGKMKLELSLGLGHKANLIPPAEPSISEEHRLVELGWHPVAGFAGKWFAEQTGLGKMVTEKFRKCPDPTQHWAVLVGEYVHQLWMDENLDVIYINEKINREEWHVHKVGKTRFNDEALRQAGEMVIYNMREKNPAYHLISNNCQTFALLMLQAIKAGGHQQFATSYAVYQQALGQVSISNLLAGLQSEKQEGTEVPQVAEAIEDGDDDNMVKHGQELMDKYTTNVDDHRSLT